MKKQSVILTLLFFVLLKFSSEVNASNCTILSQNTSAAITTKTGTKCIEFRGLNYSKTYFTADPSFQQNAAYDLEIKNGNGKRLLKKVQKASTSSTNLKLNTYYNTTVRVYLKPLTHDTHYEFFVVHDENTSTNESTIYIGLNSKYEKPFIEPEPCEGCWVNSTPVNTQFSTIIAQNQYNTMSSSGTDAPQCTDANRPPDAAPVDSKTNEELNINSLLRVSKSWADSIKHTHSTTTKYAASIARMVAMHRTDGALDLSHGGNTKYTGSAAMGNFLYGANSRAMGLPDWLIIRGAAAYQAISDNKGVWSYGSVTQGVVNFIKNDGDNPGDPEQTIRGIRYHDEVFEKNQSDRRSSSCEDLESKSESSSPGGPVGGGSEGGNTGGNTGGSGGIPIGGGSGGGGGSKTCFVQDGFTTYCWAV